MNLQLKKENVTSLEVLHHRGSGHSRRNMHPTVEAAVVDMGVAGVVCERAMTKIKNLEKALKSTEKRIRDQEAALLNAVLESESDRGGGVGDEVRPASSYFAWSEMNF